MKLFQCWFLYLVTKGGSPPPEFKEKKNKKIKTLYKVQALHQIHDSSYRNVGISFKCAENVQLHFCFCLTLCAYFFLMLFNFNFTLCPTIATYDCIYKCFIIFGYITFWNRINQKSCHWTVQRSRQHEVQFDSVCWTNCRWNYEYFLMEKCSF